MPAPTIHAHHLPYAALLAARAPDAVDTVVIHCTELPDLATARAYGERVLYASGTGNSGHYYIDRDGRIEEYAPPARIAHHTRGWNARSVGIELVNTGRFPDWLDSRRQAMDEPYTEAQIAGHEDLDRETVPASDDPAVAVRRKRDPGPRFPWPQVLAAVPLRRLQPATAPV